MRPDIFDLERFYRSRLGESARKLISTEIRQLWPDSQSLRMLGIGFATPFLHEFSDAEITLALMPATQGVWPWPPDSPSCTALGREDELPFADASFDRIVLAHALECSPHPNRLLRECWRLIADDGTLIVIVPNRRGIWCWSDRTPFGSGQPFNSGQLRRLMHSHLFEIVQTRGALYMPPWPVGWARRFATTIERVGVKVLPQLCGVHIIEASKQVYVGTHELLSLRPSSRRYIASPQALRPAPQRLKTES